MARFRHDPRASILRGVPRADSALTVAWDVEPALAAYRRFTHAVDGRPPVPVPVCATPLVVSGVGVVVAGYDGRIRLLDPTLGVEYWQRRLRGPVYASLVADHERQTVLVATTRGEIACYDLRGSEVWRVETDGEFYARPLVLPDAGVVVLSSFGGRVFGRVLATGEACFERPLPQPWAAGSAAASAHRDPYASPVAAVEDTIVVCCAEHVLALAPDGSLRWQHEVGRAIRASPAVTADGEVLVCTVDGRCHFLDAGSGRSTAPVDVGWKVVASPAVSGDIVVVGATDDRVVGIDARSHTVRWRARGAPRDHSSFSLLPSGGVVATTAAGNVVARAAVDGAFAWETSQLLGLAEHDPAIDTTPIAAESSMYCGSYSGMLYRFQFRTPAPA